MGLKGDAAIVGVADYKNERKYTGPKKFYTEQYAQLTAMALADAGLSKDDIDGMCCAFIPESNMFVPATLAEYLGLEVNFAEYVDLGGATPVGMVWRAAAAIELGICQAVVCAAPALPVPSNPNPRVKNDTRFYGSTSANWGSPQAEFDVPYGNVAQNAGYALIANRYAEMRARQDDRTLPVTARSVETVIRLATAHAKARISDVVEAEPDCETAMDILSFALYHENTNNVEGKILPVVSDEGDSDEGEEAEIDAEDVTGERPSQRRRLNEETPSIDPLEAVRTQIWDALEANDGQMAEDDLSDEFDAAVLEKALDSLATDGRIMRSDGQIVQC